MPNSQTLFAFVLVALAGFNGTASASESQSQQDKTVSCLSTMETETTWDECRTLMFSPCAEEAVGSEPHLICLEAQNTAWQDHIDTNIAVLNEKLTPDATGQLNELLGQWFGYLKSKCESVATENASISSAAAGLGCEISEFAGLATEFQSCLRGTSTSPYCELKE